MHGYFALPLCVFVKGLDSPELELQTVVNCDVGLLDSPTVKEYKLPRSGRFRRCFPSQHLGAVNHPTVNTSDQDMGFGGRVAPSVSAAAFSQNSPPCASRAPIAGVAKIRSEPLCSTQAAYPSWTRETCQFVQRLLN